MALRNILKDSDPSLRKKSREVTDFNKRLHQLLDDMRETLIEADGVGLAAPQVGVLRRVVLVVDTVDDDTSDDSDDSGEDPHIEEPHIEEQIIELINPEIISESGEQEGAEGCLSVPGVYGVVKRPDLVTVRAQDRFGKPFEVTGRDLTARAFCHEVDHLNGVLFSDFVTKYLTKEELEEMRAGEKSKNKRRE